MSDQYRAREEDWLMAEEVAGHDGEDGYYAMRCVLELRARVHALEQRPIAGDHEHAPVAEESSVTAPPDAEDEPQTLHSVALRMVDTLERMKVLPEILDTLRRAIREPMEPAASCPHIRSSDEGTSYCALAQQGNSSASLTGSPAPAGGLVERVAIACARPSNKTRDDQARAAIREVAAWRREVGAPASARDLEQEATRQEERADV
jgi:hypothetical protein